MSSLETLTTHIELLVDAEIPERYLLTRELNRAGPWEEAGKKIAGRLGKGIIVALVGPSGTGKSQIGANLVYHACKHMGVKGRFCEAMDFFLDLKSTYGRAERSENEVISEYVRPSLLVIDEFDKRGETAWENTMIFYLINKRYNAVRDTVIISNLKKDTFEKSIGAPIVSRMNETGGIVCCDWKSFRQ
jgi:DNA replication protein DnaC